MTPEPPHSRTIASISSTREGLLDDLCRYLALIPQRIGLRFRVSGNREAELAPPPKSLKIAPMHLLVTPSFFKKTAGRQPMVRPCHSPASTDSPMAQLVPQPRWMVIAVAVSAIFVQGVRGEAADASQRYRTPSYQSGAVAAHDEALLAQVDEAIERTSRRYLNVQQHTPWQILHGLLALRGEYMLRDGDQLVNAIDHISSGATFNGKPWFEATPYGGRAHPYSGVMYEFEGHANQSLAIISMSNLPLDHEFRLPTGRTLTMADMIRHAKMSVTSNEEITWTLWFLTHYLDPEATWTNKFGQNWGMETLVRIQIDSEPTRAPCGGTHGLFALAYARNAYLKKHGTLRGTWLEADQKLQRYIAAARAMQNADGTFATKFFRSTGYSREFNERIKSTGHMLEWLMMALPERRLNEEWVTRAVRALSNDLVVNASQPAECGPLYHALHSLVLYRGRVQPDAEPATPKKEEQLAEEAKPTEEPAGPVTDGGSEDEARPATPSGELTDAATKDETSTPAGSRPVQIAQEEGMEGVDKETVKEVAVPEPMPTEEAKPEQPATQEPASETAAATEETAAEEDETPPLPPPLAM